MSPLALTRFLACILLAVSISALANTNQDWATAKAANSAESYASFIEKHPNSKYSKEAAAALKRSRFSFATQSNDTRVMEMFVKLYPEGADTEEVNRLLSALRKTQIEDAARQKTQSLDSPPVPASPDRLAAIKRLRWWAILGLALNALVLLFAVMAGVDAYKTAETKASPGQARGCLWGAITLAAVCTILWSVKLGIAPDTEGITTLQILSSLFALPVGLFMFFAGVFANTPAEERENAAREARMAPIRARLADHEAVEQQVREGKGRGFRDPQLQSILLYGRRDSERIISTLSRRQTKAELLEAFSALASTLSVHNQDQASVCRGIVDSGTNFSEEQLCVLRDDFLRNAKAFLSSTSNAV